MLDNSLYEADFRISLRDIKLRLLAAQYHNECDCYDDRICSARNKYGESTPSTSAQYQLVNSNAIHVRNKIVKIGEREGFSKDEIFKAIKDHHKYNK